MAMNLSDWMGQLPEAKKKLPVGQLCIPGTHDSFSYHLDTKGPLAPDASEVVQMLCSVFGQLAKRIVKNWSTCQSWTATEQLQNGIRYFDFRLAKLDGSLRIVHGLYGPEVSTILREIAEFLKRHSSEVVILDFQHAYLDEADQRAAFDMVTATLAPLKLCPTPDSLGGVLSLKDMLKNEYRAILIYPQLQQSQQEITAWSRNWCLNPWYNTVNLSFLQESMTADLLSRDPGLLFVSQAIITPNVTLVFLFTYLKLKTFVHRCNAAIAGWISKDVVRLHMPNVVITDYPQIGSLPAKLVALNRI